MKKGLIKCAQPLPAAHGGAQLLAPPFTLPWPLLGQAMPRLMMKMPTETCSQQESLQATASWQARQQVISSAPYFKAHVNSVVTTKLGRPKALFASAIMALNQARNAWTAQFKRTAVQTTWVQNSFLDPGFEDLRSHYTLVALKDK